MRRELAADGVIISAICADAITAHHEARFGPSIKNAEQLIVERLEEKAADLKRQALEAKDLSEQMRARVTERALNDVHAATNEAAHTERTRRWLLEELIGAMDKIIQTHKGDLTIARLNGCAHEANMVEAWMKGADGYAERWARHGGAPTPTDEGLAAARAELAALSNRKESANMDPLAGMIQSSLKDNQGRPV